MKYVNPLLPAIRGDSYGFRLTFPSALYLAGSPGDVLAQIRKHPEDVDPPAFVWDVTVDGANLIVSTLELDLEAGEWWTDVQVGTVTYLPPTMLEIIQDVSRAAAP